MARRPRGRIISVFQDFATIYVYNDRENYIISMIVFFFRLHIPLTHPRTDGTAPRRHRDGRRLEKDIFVQVRIIYLSNSGPTVPGAPIRDFPAAPRLPALLRSRRPAPQLRPCRQELGVTPPAVAHRIRMLESHLGAELFERRRRGAILHQAHPLGPRHRNRGLAGDFLRPRQLLLPVPHRRLDITPHPLPPGAIADRSHVSRHPLEEALLRGLALLRRLFRETCRLRHLVEVVVFLGVATLLGRRAGRNQEAGQVPVRGTHPSERPPPHRGLRQWIRFRARLRSCGQTV